MPPAVIDVRKADDPRDVVHIAVQALAEGQLVVFPTETVYGLAASALAPGAVERLHALKGTDKPRPYTLAIKSAEEAADYAPRMSSLANRLARRCWPGPITLVVDGEDSESLLARLPDAARAAVAPEGTVGLRVPAHPLIHEVLQLLAGPLILTSANRSGEPEGTTAEEIVAALGDGPAVVLDDGRCRYGQPSTVVKVDGESYNVLRQGVLSEQALGRLASRMVVFVCTGNTCRSPMAELLFRQKMAEKLGCGLAELEDQGMLVGSAGIAAMMGGRASPEAVDVMQRRELELGEHRSQPLTAQVVRQADLLLTMTRSHRDAILAEWPDAALRTRTLCHDEADVGDPIGGPVEAYERCARQIETEIDRVVTELDF
jgi:tRNA threonylcarbamoyl adenosine modification protein (Sua5/YciO/YrdC/YwlC family)